MQKTLEEQLQEIVSVGPPPIERQGTPFGNDIQAVKAVMDTLINKLKELEAQGAIRPITIYDLDESHTLRQPIQAILQESGDAFLASWPELHLYAEGATPNDAIAALKAEIIQLYGGLSLTPASELGILPQRWLMTLKQVLQTNA